MPTLGPNTNAPLGVLSPKVVLVCGEDRQFLLPFAAGVAPHAFRCVEHVGSALADGISGAGEIASAEADPTNFPAGVASHAFRCFEFWKLPNYTLVLCGMGTGCVEPLVWEILRHGIIREIVLIGTAGKMPAATVEIGRPYAVAEAYLAGTALDGEGIEEPLRPRWDHVAGVSSVSTDFFYGFSPRLLDGGYPIDKGELARRYRDHLGRGTQFVDMEVAAFYCFCERFGDAGLKYLAIKGASNELGAEGQQIAETGAVIERCMREAMRMLKIPGG